MCANKKVKMSAERVGVVIFDLETTGLSPEKNEITEIAALEVGSLAKFQSYAKPQNGFISTRITQLTGISDETVAEAGSPPETVARFFDWVDRLPYQHVTLVGHNALGFDIKFLSAAAARATPMVPVRASAQSASKTMSVFDSYLYARTMDARARLGIENLKQTTIYKAVHDGQDAPSAHSAVGDVVALHSILQKTGWIDAVAGTGPTTVTSYHKPVRIEV